MTLTRGGGAGGRGGAHLPDFTVVVETRGETAAAQTSKREGRGLCHYQE